VDPYVFVPPGSGSVITRYGSGSSSKNSKKNLDPYCFVTFCDFFLSLKNDVNVASKSKKVTKLGKIKFFVAILKVTDENSRNPIRIRSRIH
jgi:hypothetical protein